MKYPAPCKADIDCRKYMRRIASRPGFNRERIGDIWRAINEYARNKIAAKFYPMSIRAECSVVIGYRHFRTANIALKKFGYI